MGFKTSFALATISAFFALAPAQAAVFQFEKAKPANRAGFGNPAAGNNTYIKTTFDTDTEELTWESTFTPNINGNLADGAWLVLSDGENPKTNVNEYAIFYLDGHTDTVTAYNYNGVNSASSYINNTFLESVALDVVDVVDTVTDPVTSTTTSTVSERTFKFSIDATNINNNSSFGSAWKGVGFEENIGIWYHGVDPLTASYNPDGSLSDFSFPTSGWYDVGNRTTTKVPEPGSVAAIGLFAAAAASKLRKRIG